MLFLSAFSFVFVVVDVNFIVDVPFCFWCWFCSPFIVVGVIVDFDFNMIGMVSNVGNFIVADTFTHKHSCLVSKYKALTTLPFFACSIYIKKDLMISMCVKISAKENSNNKNNKSSINFNSVISHKNKKKRSKPTTSTITLSTRITTKNNDNRNYKYTNNNNSNHN